jgi:Flp pilus assembly protein TadB
MSWSSPEERERRLRRARALSVVALVLFVVAAAAIAGVVVLRGPDPLLLLAGLLLLVSGVRLVLRLRAIGRALAEPPEA